MKRDTLEDGSELSEGFDESVLRSMVGYNVKRAYIVIHSVVQNVLSEFELRVLSFSCLSVIVSNPGIAPSKLADMMGMERSNLVVVIDDLETRELVTRKQMKTDRRRYELTATMRGRRLHDKAAEAIRRNERRLLTRLSDDEQSLLVSLLNKIEAGTTS